MLIAKNILGIKSFKRWLKYFDVVQNITILHHIIFEKYEYDTKINNLYRTAR